MIKHFQARARALAALAGLFALLGALSLAPSAQAASNAGACTDHCWTQTNANTFTPEATRINSTMDYQCDVGYAGWTGAGGWTGAEPMWANAHDNGTVETGIINFAGDNGNPVFYWVRYGGSYGTGIQIYSTHIRAYPATHYPMRTQWNPGNSTWTIYDNGTLTGTLSSPTGPIHMAAAGLEAVGNGSTFGKLRADTYGLQRVQNAVTYANWPGAAANTFYNGPPFAAPSVSTDGEIAGNLIGSC
jgi:hypothetical protein